MVVGGPSALVAELALHGLSEPGWLALGVVVALPGLPGRPRARRLRNLSQSARTPRPRARTPSPPRCPCCRKPRAPGIDPAHIHVVDNTMIDSVFRYLPLAIQREPWSRLGVEPNSFALVTLPLTVARGRRRSSGPNSRCLADLAGRLPVVFPLHPRTEARLSELGLGRDRRLQTGIRFCPPLGYLEFLALEAKAAFVLTDSGGVQEETSALGVRCFTLRDATERPVTVECGTNMVVGTDPDRIRTIPQLLGEKTPSRQIPLWDGRAGVRAARVLVDFLERD